jgi:hypothetical protein
VNVTHLKDYHHRKLNNSGSYNGRRAVSETDNVGPIPTPEAIFNTYKAVD